MAADAAASHDHANATGVDAEAIAGFYALQASDDAYVAGKRALDSGSRELAQAWRKIRFALDGATTVLDWGCRHGVFAWLARQELGSQAQLHGCDTSALRQYAVFHEASGLQYRRLDHPWHLPYEDASFDVVLAGGVLEHVPNDGQSLNELWRVLKPRGRLVLTHLPNATSATEWLSRRLWPQQAHLRRYRLPSVRRRLLHKGFVPLRWGRHQMVPTRLPANDTWPRTGRLLERLFHANAALERVWPLNRLSATLWLVAEKRPGL